MDSMDLSSFKAIHLWLNHGAFGPISALWGRNHQQLWARHRCDRSHMKQLFLNNGGSSWRGSHRFCYQLDGLELCDWKEVFVLLPTDFGNRNRHEGIIHPITCWVLIEDTCLFPSSFPGSLFQTVHYNKPYGVSDNFSSHRRIVISYHATLQGKSYNEPDSRPVHLLASRHVN